MKPFSRSFPFALGSVTLVATLWLIGCADHEATTPGAPDFVAGKGGGGSKDPAVKAVDPDTGVQGTELDVEVTGSGYDETSQVRMLLNLLPSQGVTTNSTTFLNSRKLLANITIAENADTGLYDVEVTAAKGDRKGIGTELFEVKEKGKPNFGPPITVEFRDLGTDVLDPLTDKVRSDGRGIYVDRECGVSATFNLTDARLDPAPAANKIHPKEATACGGRDPRVVKVALTQPTDDSPPHSLDGTTADGKGLLVDEVELVLLTDGTVQRTAVLHGPFGCALGLRFNPNLDPMSNFVDVTQNPDGSWTVTTQSAPNDVAVCLPDENNQNAGPPRYYHLPFEITVRLQ